MNHILVEKSPSPSKLDVLGVESWPVKTMAPGKHRHDYTCNTEFYIGEGKATLSCEAQPEETVCDGDLVFILEGSTVTWEVIDTVEYHRRPD